jgi:hypothetical protein
VEEISLSSGAATIGKRASYFVRSAAARPGVVQLVPFVAFVLFKIPLALTTIQAKEHKHRANVHDLRFWSQVQGELIQFCHDWWRGSEQRQLYDLAIDLDRIVEMTPEEGEIALWTPIDSYTT